MKKRFVVLIILVVIFIISFIFPVRINTLNKGYKSDITAIELKDEEYVFDIIPDGNDFNGLEYRFCTFDTIGHKGIIHYKFVDSDGNTLFENSEKISEIKTNAYRSEYFDKIKKSKGKTFKFIVWYDEYYKDEKFGIWGSLQSTKGNFLENDNNYGMEVYVKCDTPNVMVSWFVLIAISIDLLYIFLEKDYAYEKEK